ncbi:probable E3 ubiquitin-protein ligase BAH1-like 1 [Rosa rugosa]|uniref:probable E3 ubiquitin-protein ligase BAH1-like 1 n=1 Tax=Rosa rugosa TaxID=74645 RepID=UPI002B415CDB|nr:probable E3 ubiquitin-protein ligase BAH1-like 1 [Rosa rugosa]
MKFADRYQQFMKEQKEEVPVIRLSNLKAVLKNCEIKDMHPKDRNTEEDCDCPVCDRTFFPSILKDMSVVVNFFNKRAQEILYSHLASGFKKYILRLKRKLKLKASHENMIKEAQDLVGYATITAFAIQKILKKYDKVHCSKKGQRFKYQAQTMKLELLKSPWLLELMAFHINVSKNRDESKTIWFVDFSLHKDDEHRPLFLVNLPHSIELNLDLTCPICLDTVFDPVFLTCSHILCHMCACSVASVTIVEGLQAATSAKKCPICRKGGVFGGAVQLAELSMLLSRSMPKYWKGRLQRERQERIKQAKEFWESECRLFLE